MAVFQPQQTPQFGSKASGVGLAFNSNNTAGNTILVWVQPDFGLVQPTITDTRSNTYSLVDSATSGGTLTGWLFAAHDIAAGANTVTVTSAGRTFEIILVEVTKGSTVLTVDKTVHNGAVGTNPTSGSTATTTAAAAGVYGFVSKNNGNLSDGAGFSALANGANNFFNRGEYKIVAATGAYSADFVSATSGTYRCVCAVLKETPPPNTDPPVITSGTIFHVVEGSTAVGTVTATGDGTIAFAVTAGDDQALFTIDESSGEISAIDSLDYEDPADTDFDSYYRLTITATNEFGSDSKNIAVIVDNDPADDSFAPTLPRLTVDPTLPIGWDGTASVTPSDSAALVTALANVNQNGSGPYIIELTAGVTYTGNFVIQNKAGSRALIIRSSGLGSLPAGTRVSTASANSMAKIVTSNTGRALYFNEQAHDIYLLGLEITSSDTSSTALVMLGTLDSNSSDTATATSQLPLRVVFDRCYIHGTSTGNFRRGIAANARYLAVVNSYFEDFHEVGADSQAICAWNTNGPLLIRNNHLAGAGENILIGGADPTIPNSVTADVTIDHNYFYKPLSWKEDDPSYAGTLWSVKNSFELKSARRVLFEHNTIENCWLAAQDGTAVNIKPSNAASASWSLIEDVTFRYNTIKNVANGLKLGNDDSDGFATENMKRVLIEQNLMLLDQNNFGGASRPFMFVKGGTVPATWVRILHNTCLMLGAQSETIAISVGDEPGFCNDIVINDNIISAGTYGVKGPGATTGKNSLDTHLPGYTFLNNVLIGANVASYPATTLAPADENAVGFTDYAAGNYALLSSSPYHNAASDGTDIGAQLSTDPASGGSKVITTHIVGIFF